MKLLALDTSTEACSVALQIGESYFHLDEVCPQQQSKRILPMIQQVLSEADLCLSQLDGLVFGRGPGSFTGVRIGVAVAQGLGFGADLPVYGVSTLAAMAQTAYRLHAATRVISAIDARMNEVYLGTFAWDSQYGMQSEGEEIAIKPQALEHRLFEGDYVGVGTGWQTYAVELNRWSGARILTDICYPSARDMLTLAQPALRAGQFVAAELAAPVYVRDEVTWQKLPGR